MTRRALPLRHGFIEDEPAAEPRRMDDEGFELSTLSARAQADPLVQREEFVDGIGIERSPEPVPPKPLRGDARDDRLDPRREIVPEQGRLVHPPERREHAKPEVMSNDVHAAVLVVRRDRTHDQAIHSNRGERLTKRVQFSVLSHARRLLNERDPDRLRKERNEVQVWHMVKHRRGILR